MTKKEKQLWLNAIGKLRKHYKKYLPEVIPFSYWSIYKKNCPLCISSRLNCENCLWLRFEVKDCLSSLYNFTTTQQRLDRLDRWEELLDKE